MTANKVKITIKVAFPQFKKSRYTAKIGKTLDLNKALKNADGAEISYSIDEKDAGKAEITDGILTAKEKASKGIVVTARVNGIDYTTKVKIK